MGRPKEEWGLNPSTFSEMWLGSYDIHERVRDINRNGILASMCFPSYAGFSARRVGRELPGPFRPLAIAPVWDRDELAEEVRRVAAKGVKAVTMPELPHIQRLPNYHDLEYWDPFFRASARTTSPCGCTSDRGSPPSATRPTRRSTT
ncbi:hypothetical protein ABZ490_50370 [Streptomyces sp. NPDC005811]|uniref:hypothetical protein n=1 Tax=Streptomyces sp. NPDC005811 TaxID=3154565 RepID=UPI0033BFFF18